MVEAGESIEVRRGMAMTLTCIAKRANMGAAGSKASLLHDAGKNENNRLCEAEPFDYPLARRSQGAEVDFTGN